jgi:hypothetical protein
VERYESHPHSQLPSIGGVGANTNEMISRSWSIVIRNHDDPAKNHASETRALVPDPSLFRSLKAYRASCLRRIASRS